LLFLRSAKQPMKKYLLPACCLFLAACHNTPDNTDTQSTTVTAPPASVGVGAPQNISLNVVGVYPHDTSSFTEGFEIYKGKIYESAGDFTNSSLRIEDIKTGKVEKKHMMGSSEIFGEGITIFKDKIYQLTWQTHVVYVYDINNIDKPVKTFTWPYEGWGQTHDSTQLILSDGSSNIYLVDPDNYRIKSTIQVVDENGPVTNVNELEYIDGYVYANVWETNFIIKIDPSNGHVVGRITVPDLLKQFAPDLDPALTGIDADGADVLNGIAYDHDTRKMYITGKRWPKIFEVTLN
jgi:glutaminyl-peptide cyclotransferase